MRDPLDRTLQQDRGTETLSRADGCRLRVSLHLAALNPQHPGQFTGVRGEQTSFRQFSRQQAQGVGVDDHGNAVGGSLDEPVGVAVVGAPARAQHPGLDAPFPNDDRRGPTEDEGHDRGRSGESHHPRATAQRSEDAQHRRPGEPFGTGVDTDDSAGVLVVEGTWHRPEHGHLGQIAVLVDPVECLSLVIDEIQTDAMNLQLTAELRGRIRDVTPLEAGEGQGVSGVDTGLHLAGVGIQA